MTTPPLAVLVVIVNYRTPALVVDCLRSLEPQVRALPKAAVVVVDNASGDDSVPVIGGAIAANGWTWASLLPSPTNGGFAAGNNLAIRPALASSAPPDVFWLLNPDTVAEPGALGALVQFLHDHPDVGICGGRLVEGNGEAWRVALKFPGVLSEFERGFQFGPVTRLLRRWAVLQPIADEPIRVDWVSGASMAIRRSTFERIGLFDDGYFLYYEETDFCRRAYTAGIACWQEPRSRIVHIAGQSTLVTARSEAPRRVPAYWFESRRRYFVRNHGRLYAIVADLAWLTAHCLGSLRRLLQRKSAATPPHLLSDFLQHSALWRTPAKGHSHDTASAGLRETHRVSP